MEQVQTGESTTATNIKHTTPLSKHRLMSKDRTRRKMQEQDGVQEHDN